MDSLEALCVIVLSSIVSVVLSKPAVVGVHRSAVATSGDRKLTHDSAAWAELQTQSELVIKLADADVPMNRT
jgi:hypothetical protein